MHQRLVFALCLAVVAAGCSNRSRDDSAASTERPSAAPSAVSSTTPATVAIEPRGDAAKGRVLVDAYECGRCHDGLAEAAPIPVESHCTHCHQKVMAGGFDDKPDHVQWKKNVAHLADIPSLQGAGKRFRYDWLVDFLMKPRDLRPHLAYSMPALDLTREQARNLATYLVSLDEGEPPKVSFTSANPARGRKLLEDKGCTGCHTFSGVPAWSTRPAATQSGATALAPDLRHARDRLAPGTLLAWITDPKSLKPDTPMPQLPLEPDEARDMAAYIHTADLAPQSKPSLVAMTTPEPLDREVTYEEVETKLLGKTCRHCHGNPDVALGDGGPGNTGGFGYRPAKLELTSYSRVHAGMLDAEGVRQSVFEKGAYGTPRLVAALLERHREVAGEDDPELRGMPLALPPVPMEDIRLLVTWIEAGRPR